MSLFSQIFDVCGLRATVVTGENEKGVVKLTVLAQGGVYFSEDIVCLHHEIAIRAQTAFSLPLGAWDNRRVR